jgi:hypothetical protein
LAYSPSKLYPYVLSRRPILALVFRGSELEKILRELNCATLAVADDEQNFSEALGTLMAFFQTTLDRLPGESRPPANEALPGREYLARSLTARQTAFFDAAIQGPHVELC